MALVEVKFVKLSEDAIIPTKGTKKSAGWDFYSAEDIEVKPKQTLLISTGLAWEPSVSMKDRDNKHKKLEKHKKEYPLIQDHLQVLQELNEETYSFYENNFLVRMEMTSRSSVFSKHGIIITGKIDEDYRGEIKIMAHNASNQTFKVKKGDRIAQGEIGLVPSVNVKEVKNIDIKTERSTGGFGSTNERV